MNVFSDLHFPVTLPLREVRESMLRFFSACDVLTIFLKSETTIDDSVEEAEAPVLLTCTFDELFLLDNAF